MIDQDLARFYEIPFSVMGTHAQECCLAARASLLAKIEQGTVEGTLAQIPVTLPWAPIAWPAYWCDLMNEGQATGGDCGVHAAIARVVLDDHQIDHVPARVAIESPEAYREHWRAMWHSARLVSDWIGDELVYHEVVYTGGRFWDPSESRFFSRSRPMLLAGRVAAVQVGVQDWEIF